MILCHDGIPQRVILQIEFHKRAGEREIFLHSETLAERSRGDITYHHLKRENGHLSGSMPQFIHLGDEVIRNSLFFKVAEKVRTYPVVEPSLALSGYSFFLR